MITKRRDFVFRYLPGLFLSGLLLLSGCSQDDVSDVPAGSRAIGFRAQGGMSSLKATTANANSIQSFVVNARYNASDEWDNAASKFLLQGITVYRGEDDNWAYSPQAYFPTESGGSVDFFAYSPSGSKNVESGLKDADTEDQEISYTVPVPAGASTVQEDFLVARTNVEPGDYNETVKLQFRHALSRILVRARSGLAAPVTITGLTLRNLYSEGTLKLSDIGASGWSYNASVDATDDYVTWSTPATLTDYPYFLPEAGVSVGADYKYVVGEDQGIFVLPQTTNGDPTAGAPKDGVVNNSEFGLEISYTVNGIAAPEYAFVQFADLNDIDDTGVTFENGRQYVLNLSFGSGSGSGSNPDDPDAPSIVIGADISFGPLGVDNYPDNIQAPAPPDPNKKYWAASNIYFLPGDGESGTSDTGALTFSEDPLDGKEGYQGVYFKWGSLIGVDAASGVFSDANYLFVPDLATGTYERVAVSALDGNELYIIGQDWDGSDMDALWNTIAYADVSVINTSVTNDRSDARLTDREFVTSATGYEDYTGDICKFLSVHKETSNGGLDNDYWILPTSNNFGPPTDGNAYDGSVYGKYNEGENTAGNVNGIGGTLFGVKLSYVLNDDPVGFPASGIRGIYSFTPPDNYSDWGYLNGVGDLGYYWSSSANGGAYAYGLAFDVGGVYPANGSFRAYGRSVRCVRSY
ncbi:MAG: fimbrillin family protein [Prevotella sp.]|jgi:hypothetical protein|nr:fimbrillin family protein [Prevotella sp.]